MKRKVRPVKTVDAAGGVLYRDSSEEEEILLICRRGIWDLPKGKREEDETFEECALREVSEEVGAEQITLEKHLLNTYHEYAQDGTRYGKTTKWYSMKMARKNQDLVPQQEEGITDLLWISVEDAQKRVGFQNLVDVIEAFAHFREKKREA